MASIRGSIVLASRPLRDGTRALQVFFDFFFSFPLFGFFLSIGIYTPESRASWLFASLFVSRFSIRDGMGRDYLLAFFFSFRLWMDGWVDE